MSTATAGRAREHLVRRNLERHGWRQIVRAAASKGSCDLVMVHAVHGLALVQVGTARSKTLGPADRARFLADADDAGALALLATVLPGVGVRYRLVNAGTPRAWAAWDPAEVSA